jgi:outer membrane protein OmpA-like peptidoglycan-associated protein
MVASADNTTHMGSRIGSKQEFIDALAPSEPPLTRGIKLNSQPSAAESAAAAAPPPPRTVSMNIQFALDSYQLTEQAVQQLQPLGEAMKSNELATLNFSVEGHTDARGSEEYNLHLSQMRANAVKGFLVQNFGIEPSRLNSVGKGEYQLMDANDPNNAVNRRVSITTVSK